MALIKRLPTDLGINFVDQRKLFLLFSALLILLSIGSVLVRGLNLGVDFKGGTLIEIRTKQVADLGALRAQINDLGIGEATLQEFGTPTDVLINLQRQDGEEKEQIAAINLVKETLGDRVAEYRRVEFVGPKVGAELRQAGFLATVLALGAIALYIWFRFEWQFAAASLLALIHDVVATVGFFALLQIEFNLSTLAAVLTVAGYSINDTVVVFDRVRENLRRYKKMPMLALLNNSINQTLSRTLLTSFTTLLALVALYLFGGEVIRGFSAGLIWGIFIGTYSSIALAVPLLHTFRLRREHLVLNEEESDTQTVEQS
jgi:preprotein translocase SecF subunit|tara:strand:- start:10883 stop:11830 length:948 start_codon:yes stop_codon:yes gene_type:complete